jgi:AAA domain
VAGASLHDNMRDLAASCVAKGYKDADIATLLRSLLRSSAAPRDDRWLDRYNSIGALVHSAREKYGKEEGSTAANDLRSTLRAYVPRAFSEIPRRQWLHAGHYIRQQVVMTIAPGGFGKTALILCNTMEICTGKGLIGPGPIEGPLRVLYWNAEDPEEEVERRIAALCIQYQIDASSLRGHLFLGSKINNGERLAKINRKTGEVILNKPLFAGRRAIHR